VGLFLELDRTNGNDRYYVVLLGVRMGVNCWYVVGREALAQWT